MELYPSPFHHETLMLINKPRLELSDGENQMRRWRTRYQASLRYSGMSFDLQDHCICNALHQVSSISFLRITDRVSSVLAGVWNFEKNHYITASTPSHEQL